MIKYLKRIHDMIWKLKDFYLFKIPDYLKKITCLEKTLLLAIGFLDIHGFVLFFF